MLINFVLTFLNYSRARRLHCSCVCLLFPHIFDRTRVDYYNGDDKGSKVEVEHMVNDRNDAVEEDSHHEADLRDLGLRLRKLTCLNRTIGGITLIGHHIVRNYLPIGHFELLQAHK